MTSSLVLSSAAEKQQQKEVWSSRLQKWLYERFGVYIEDFRFQPEESTVEAEEPLSAKRSVGAVRPMLWFTDSSPQVAKETNSQTVNLQHSGKRGPGM